MLKVTGVTTLELNCQLNHVLSCIEIFHFITIFHFHQHYLYKELL